VSEVGNEQKWVSVFLGNSVKASEVDASLIEPSFFPMKRTGAPWEE